MSSQKLNIFIHGLSGGAISKKRFNMRIASEEKSEELSGFITNSVCPLGLCTQLPTIIAQSIVDLQPDIMFLGAGHVDWKMGVSAADLITAIRSLGRMVWTVDLS
jgi:prolyl-tRNA editing enzyme YbaK/EbsC (Cys-tRNA(Pro) deacylase)